MTDFSGEWIDNSFEGDDRGGPRTVGPSRANGLQPDAWLGNFLGIPYNDAGRQKGVAFDLSIYSHPAWLFRPHPVQYSMRGVISQWRMSKEINPLNGRLVASCLYGLFSRPQHVVTTAHGSRRPGLLECGDRSSEAFPYRGRAMFERRPSVAADDCAETQTHPGRPAVAPY